MTVNELIKCLKEFKKQGHGSSQVLSEEEDGGLLEVNSVYKGYSDGIVLSADEPVTKE